LKTKERILTLNQWISHKKKVYGDKAWLALKYTRLSEIGIAFSQGFVLTPYTEIKLWCLYPQSDQQPETPLHLNGWEKPDNWGTCQDTKRKTLATCFSTTVEDLDDTWSHCFETLLLYQEAVIWKRAGSLNDLSTCYTFDMLKLYCVECETNKLVEDARQLCLEGSFSLPESNKAKKMLQVLLAVEVQRKTSSGRRCKI